MKFALGGGSGGHTHARVSQPGDLMEEHKIEAIKV